MSITQDQDGGWPSFALETCRAAGKKRKVTCLRMETKAASLQKSRTRLRMACYVPRDPILFLEEERVSRIQERINYSELGWPWGQSWFLDEDPLREDHGNKVSRLSRADRSLRKCLHRLDEAACDEAYGNSVNPGVAKTLAFNLKE